MLFPFTFPFVFGGEVSESGSYSSQLAKLLPPGIAWDLEDGSELRETLLAMSDELERVRFRGLDLINETDPRTASETIGDWETAFGLPDERVTSISSDLDERRVAVTQKVVAQGGQNYTYFETICAACGWPLISITKNHGLMCRVGARVGARIYASEWSFMILLTLNSPTAGALPRADFERVIRHVTHAHIAVTFEYA